jgi:hypothetical protein
MRIVVRVRGALWIFGIFGFQFLFHGPVRARKLGAALLGTAIRGKEGGELLNDLCCHL